MSDHLIILIPGVPDYVPTEEAQRQAVALFRELAPQADAIKAETTQGVQFIDCGSNFARVICPECAQEIEMEWWQRSMSEDFDSAFHLRPVALPCCGKQKKLNELNYDWPQGFARFSVEAMNPGIGDLPADKMKAFETVLGCSVKKIRRHL